MKTCRICGSEKATYFARLGYSSCASCAKETANKVGKEAFERAYWGADVVLVPNSTRNSFFEDYLYSTYGLADYIKQTSCETV